MNRSALDRSVSRRVGASNMIGAPGRSHGNIGTLSQVSRLRADYGPRSESVKPSGPTTPPNVEAGGRINGRLLINSPLQKKKLETLTVHQ
jgi:hypothetical protein